MKHREPINCHFWTGLYVLPIHFVYSVECHISLLWGLSGYMLIYVNSTTIPTPLPLPRTISKNQQSLLAKRSQRPCPSNKLNNALVHRPFSQFDILRLSSRLRIVPFIMPSHMLHAVIPAMLAVKVLAAEPALADRWWLAPWLPASISNRVEAPFERLAFPGRRVGAVLLVPRRVHASKMLCKQVFAVEVVGNKVCAVVVVMTTAAGLFVVLVAVV